jgi:hypothetical protein
VTVEAFVVVEGSVVLAVAVAEEEVADTVAADIVAVEVVAMAEVEDIGAAEEVVRPSTTTMVAGVVSNIMPFLEARKLGPIQCEFR